MRTRLLKELRPLGFPWFIAAIASSLIPLESWFDNPFGINFGRTILFGAAPFAFVASVVLLGAVSFGGEFQQRTLQFLLSQPIRRERVWNEKLLALGFAVLTIALVYGLALLLANRLTPWWKPFAPETAKFMVAQTLCLGGTFALATVCSAGFWTLVARSTIGGMAFSFSAMFLGALVVESVVERALGTALPSHGWSRVFSLMVAGTLYSGVFLWLGWRKFEGMEVRNGTASTNLALPDWMALKELAMPLRCQPTGNLRNLIRKEVSLQKPIFTIAAVFVACWFVTLLLFALQPSRAEFWNGILNGLTVVHVTIVVLLAGCVSLGEEKSLGLAAWHLTLPVSVRRQWIAKLAVSATMLVIVGVLLPWLLSWMISFKTSVGFAYLVADRDRIGLFSTLFVMAVVFILSFWSASHVENTVHAALAALLVGVAIIPTVMFALSLSADFGGLQTGLFSRLIAHLQLPPDFFLRFAGWVALGSYFVFLAIVMMLLAQSLARFRRARQQGCAMFKSAIVLLTLVFAGTFWWADLAKSLQRQVGPFTQSLIKALVALPQANTKLISGQPWVVSGQELEQTGMLSETAKVWLRKAQITYTPPVRPNQSSETQARLSPTVTIHFPNGRDFSWSW